MGVGFSSHTLSGRGGKSRPDLCSGGLRAAGGGVGWGWGVSTLTDIQYTQLMPQTGDSNNIICAGRSHIYYPICPTGGGKDQHRRQQQQSPEFQRIFVELGGTLGDDENDSALIIEILSV